MSTVRETVVIEKWKEMRQKKMVSINDIDDLMYAVEKLIMSFQELRESRDKWRRKCMEKNKK